MKVAKLVFVSLATRVIVEHDATEQMIIDACRPALLEKIITELGEHLEEISDDIVMPYNPDVDE